MAQKLLRYLVTAAEAQVVDAAKPGDTRLTVIGNITVNGKTRKTDRANFTLAQTKRPGFEYGGDDEKRTFFVNMPTNKAGRKRLTGTKLSEIKL